MIKYSSMQIITIIRTRLCCG